MNPVVFVFVSIAQLGAPSVSRAGQHVSFESAPLVVRSERSPRTSESQVCARRLLEQGRGSVLVCDTKGAR